MALVAEHGKMSSNQTTVTSCKNLARPLAYPAKTGDVFARTGIKQGITRFHTKIIDDQIFPFTNQSFNNCQRILRHKRIHLPVQRNRFRE